MSRPKSIDSLLAGSASDIAPTVTDLNKREQTTQAAEPKPEPAEEQATKPKNPKPVDTPPKKKAPARSSELSAEGQPIRVQISTSDGSEIAAALEEVRSNIPAAFQKNFNLGAFFKEVLQDNDAEIAVMIRNNLNGGAQ